MAVKIEFVVF